ncbi:hypothetical protein GALMADRAFT_413796 [Galerina marginata CBS 339.88]|uniref:Ricin B lectin domain-containing protein n=1 Tax=Galerina marginata (strain CBS 339.88) TaxID=685588 RepID=A0A067TFQ6_GALM3|nr:hypothetical protein GALMADRAFT_413796 [Galerina marginata CBS 339.88]
MVHLNLSNITAAIAAAGGVFNIIDFQGNCVDGPGGQTEDFTGVETYTCVPGAVNQQWSLTTVGANTPITLANTPSAVL